MIRLALALMLLAAPVRAMDFEARGNTIWAKGPIERGDGARFLRFVTDHPALHVVVTSSGGLIVAANDIADTIIARRLTVTVHRQCDSACFLLLLAAKERAVVLGSQVGVHSASVDGAETDSAMAATIYEARRAAALGATPQALAKLVTTPPGGISYLSDAELVGLGVRFVAAP